MARLQEVVGRSLSEGLDGAVQGGIRGEQDGRGGRLHLLDLREEVQPGHVGHPLIDDHQIIRIGAQLFQSRGAAFRRFDLVPFQFQDLFKGGQNIRLVVNNKDSFGHCLRREPI